MPDATDPRPPVLVLVKDLMFSSTIAATARAEGATIRAVRDAAKLGELPGELLIADLNQEGAIAAAAAWVSAAPGRRAVGFVSHVDAEAIRAARAAGLEPMARSRFVQALPELLRSIGGAGRAGQGGED